MKKLILVLSISTAVLFGGFIEDKNEVIENMERCGSLDSQGCYEAGVSYIEGKGTFPTLIRAAKLFTEGCALKHAESCEAERKWTLVIGMIKEGDKAHFENKDYVTALAFYKKAADEGSARGLYNVAFFYTIGRGVEKDIDTAIKFYLLAAKKGHTDAMFNLGKIYREGQGVKQDYNKAADFFYEAALRGENNSLNQLGILYTIGMGVPLDLKQAIIYFGSSIKLGNKEAVKNLSILCGKNPNACKDLEQILKGI